MDVDRTEIDGGGLCTKCRYEVGWFVTWDEQLIGSGCIRSALNEADVTAEEARESDARVRFRLIHYFHSHGQVASCPLCKAVVS